MTYWLVALPNEKAGASATLNTLASYSEQRGLSTNTAFVIPKLRVGTLDSLMQLSDELQKVDTFVGATAAKIQQTYSDVVQQQDSVLNVHKVIPEKYVQTFRWDVARYPIQTSLPELVHQVSETSASTAEDLKKRLSKYLEVKGNLASIERKESGNLMMRSLAPLVKKSDFVDREYLTTLLVVVPLPKSAEFLQEYEVLEDKISHKKKVDEEKNGEEEEEESSSKCRIVVPRSALELARDEETVLYRVVVFRKGSELIRNVFRDQRYQVRDFQFDPAQLRNEEEDRRQLLKRRDQLHRGILRWCQSAYSEAFSSWMHIKAVRVFVESVLRYGLPVNFSVGLLKPMKGNESKLRAALTKHYAHLNSGAMAAGEGADNADFSGVAGDWYPYVFEELSF